MRKKAFWLLICIFFPPFIMAEEPACPTNIQAALKAIDQHLKNKQWVYIYHDDCPQIQAELIAKADQIVKAKNFEDYIPLMSKDTMRIIRNAFFAVKGHEFQDNALKEHFQKYSWYKPIKGKKVTLSEVESRYVDLLKKVEDQLTISCDVETCHLKYEPLLAGVEIVEKNGKRLLKFKYKNLDISTVEANEGADYEYDVSSIEHQKAILVCKRMSARGVDFEQIHYITMYSENGEEMCSFDNNMVNDDKNIHSLAKCPSCIKQYPGIFFSYSHGGSGGGISDALIIFNSKLEARSVISCREFSCGGTALFNEVNQGGVYFYLSVGEAGYYLRKVREKGGYHDYGPCNDEKCGSDKIHAVWHINKDGSVKLVSEARVNCKHVNVTASGYNIECDKPEPTINLFPVSINRDPWDKIITSFRFKEKMIIFRKQGDKIYSSIVLPLIK